MKRFSETDDNIKQRFDFWKYRQIDELYDYKNDPHALNNLVDDPNYQSVVEELRKVLKKQMQKTQDYVLEAFSQRDNIVFLNQWMDNQIKQAKIRTKTLKWKRPQNSSGSTKQNNKLYQKPKYTN